MLGMVREGFEGNLLEFPWCLAQDELLDVIHHSNQETRQGLPKNVFYPQLAVPPERWTSWHTSRGVLENPRQEDSLQAQPGSVPCCSVHTCPKGRCARLPVIAIWPWGKNPGSEIVEKS